MASQTCKGLHQFWALPQHLAFFPHMWLMGRHATPEVTHNHTMWLTGRHAIPEVTCINSLTCDLRETMLRQRSPTLIPREVEVFPGGDNHSKNVLLLTYLGWLQPIYHNSWHVFIKTAKILLPVKALIKNINQQPH